MSRAKVRSTSSNKSSSRGHTVIILQPVVVNGEDYTLGGQITVVDMAGVERTKKSGVHGEGMRETIAINSSIGTVMNCLRRIKANTEIDDKSLSNVVPYRESKLTMLLQPLLSGMIGHISITMLVSVYPGSRDFSEKKFLLKEVQSLQGLEFDNNEYNVENINPNPSSTPSKRRVFKPSNLLQKSPLRHIPKVINSIQETTANLTPSKHAHEHGDESSIHNSKDLEVENKRLFQEINELRSSNTQLSNSNRSLYEKVRELEKRVARCHCLDTEQIAFQCDDLIEFEREVRFKKQCLIPTPLIKHLQEVFQTNEAMSGFLQKSKNNPFQLVVPTDFTLGKQEDVKTNGKLT